MDRSTNDELPPSVLTMVGYKDHEAVCTIQNLITVYEEPVGFVCSLDNTEVELVCDELGTPFQQSCTEVEENLRVNFERGEMVAAKLRNNEYWWRGVLDTQKDNGSWHVLGCDIGFAKELKTSCIQPLSPDFKIVPRFSVAGYIIDNYVPVAEIWQNVIKVGNRVTVIHLERVRYNNSDQVVGTIVNEEGKQLCVVHFKDWLPLRPRLKPTHSVTTLPSKCYVTISTFCSSNRCYVRLQQDKEADYLFSRITEDVNYYCLRAKPLKEVPEVGAVIGVCSQVDQGHYRALVLRVTSPVSVLVIFIDYGNKEEARLDQLYKLPEILTQVRSQAVLVKLKDVPDKPLNVQALVFLTKLVCDAKNNEFELTFNKEGNEVILDQCNKGRNVNRVLSSYLAGSWVYKNHVDEEARELVNTYKDEYNKLNSITAIPLPLGQRVRLVCLQNMGKNGFACCLAEQPLLRFIAETLTREMTNYVRQVDNTKFSPRECELSLAQYSKDGLWYRAMALGKGFFESEVIFVDFGNSEVVPHTQLCCMPDDFEDAPCLATLAELEGVEAEDFRNEAFTKRISELLVDDSTFDGIVVSQNKEDQSVKIFAPRIINILIEENLIPESRMTGIKKQLKVFKNVKQNVDVLLQYLSHISKKKSETFEDLMTCEFDVDVDTTQLIEIDSNSTTSDYLDDASMTLEEYLNLLECNDVQQPSITEQNRKISINQEVSLIDLEENIDIKNTDVLTPEKISSNDVGLLIDIETTDNEAPKMNLVVKNQTQNDEVINMDLCDVASCNLNNDVKPEKSPETTMKPETTKNAESTTESEDEDEELLKQQLMELQKKLEKAKKKKK